MKTTRFALIVALSALLLALALAACGGGGDGEATPTPAPTEEAQGEATPTEAAEPDVGESVRVDESFWHGGWKVTIGEAELAADSFGLPVVNMDMTFENLGETGQNRFNSSLVLRSGGGNFTERSIDDEGAPNVPAGASGDALISIRVDEGFSFDDAVLVVGQAAGNQAMIPLTAGAGELVSLEPVEIAASGTATAGGLTVEVTGAEVRWDLPGFHEQAEAGMALVIVNFTATPEAGILVGQGVLQDQNVALRLPDGTTIAVRNDGRSGVNELLQGSEGTTIPDLSSRFEVPWPGEGEYAFVITGNWGPDGAEVEDEVSFQVEA